MTFWNIVLWIFCTLFLAAYIYFFLYPFLKVKVGFWLIGVKLKRKARKYTGKLAEDYNTIADGFFKISKNTKLNGSEEESDDN